MPGTSISKSFQDGRRHMESSVSRQNKLGPLKISLCSGEQMDDDLLFTDQDLESFDESALSPIQDQTPIADSREDHSFDRVLNNLDVQLHETQRSVKRSPSNPLRRMQTPNFNATNRNEREIQQTQIAEESKEVVRLTNMTALMEQLRVMGSFQGTDGTRYVIDVSTEELMSQTASAPNLTIDQIYRTNQSQMVESQVGIEPHESLAQGHRAQSNQNDEREMANNEIAQQHTQSMQQCQQEQSGEADPFKCLRKRRPTKCIVSVPVPTDLSKYSGLRDRIAHYPTDQPLEHQPQSSATTNPASTTNELLNNKTYNVVSKSPEQKPKPKEQDQKPQEQPAGAQNRKRKPRFSIVVPKPTEEDMKKYASQAKQGQLSMTNTSGIEQLQNHMQPLTTPKTSNGLEENKKDGVTESKPQEYKPQVEDSQPKKQPEVAPGRKRKPRFSIIVPKPTEEDMKRYANQAKQGQLSITNTSGIEQLQQNAQSKTAHTKPQEPDPQPLQKQPSTAKSLKKQPSINVSSVKLSSSNKTSQNASEVKQDQASVSNPCTSEQQQPIAQPKTATTSTTVSNELHGNQSADVVNKPQEQPEAAQGRKRKPKIGVSVAKPTEQDMNKYASQAKQGQISVTSKSPPNGNSSDQQQQPSNLPDATSTDAQQQQQNSLNQQLGNEEPLQNETGEQEQNEEQPSQSLQDMFDQMLNEIDPPKQKHVPKAISKKEKPTRSSEVIKQRRDSMRNNLAKTVKIGDNAQKTQAKPRVKPGQQEVSLHDLVMPLNEEEQQEDPLDFDGFQSFTKLKIQRGGSMMLPKQMNQNIHNKRILQIAQKLKDSEQSVSSASETSRVCQMAKSDALDLIFLHASPNIYNHLLKNDSQSKRNYSQLPALDFRSEQKTIKEALHDAGRQIAFQGKVATKIHFEETIRKKPKVLHISCHGVRINQNTMGINLKDNVDKGHFLLFENEFGDGELVSAQQLGDFMRKNSADLELVFVAACDSQEIGRIFQRNGARHVVCVEQNRFVLDKAAIFFTKTFYSILFAGEHEVCTAFDQAKQAVSFQISEAEANLFIMLLQEDKDDIFGTNKTNQLDHECIEFQAFPKGRWKCLSDHNSIKSIPAKLDKFKFREKDMSKILQNMLQDNEKIIPLLGLHGIGKSALARNTLHYATDRKLFTGGIMFIQLKDTRTNFSMLKIIMQKITSQLQLNEKQKQNLMDKTFSHEGMIEYLVNFFNHRQSESFIKKKNKIETKQAQGQQMFLMCLDNANQLIEHDRSEFFYFLATLYDDCPNLRLIVTSDRWIDFGLLPNKITIKPYLLRPLKDSQSVELFLDTCGIADDKQGKEELLQLIIADKNYPFMKIFSLKDAPTEITPEFQSKLRQKLNIRRNWNMILASHDMFKHFGGNPTSITMIASIYFNPIISNTLVDMYQSIKSETNIVVNELEYGRDGKPIPKVLENIMSLNVASEMSVKLISQTYPEDVDLLFFIGCLPGGVQDKQLEKMWGKDISRSLERLSELSFFETGTNKLNLTPTMISYIENHMDESSKKFYFLNICEFYRNILYESYLHIGKVENGNKHSTMTAMSSQGGSSPISLLKSTSSFRRSNNISSPTDKRVSLKLQDTLKELGQSKTVFDELEKELQNIEHCLNFIFDTARTNQEYSRIATNQGFKNSQRNALEDFELPDKLQLEKNRSKIKVNKVVASKAGRRRSALLDISPQLQSRISSMMTSKQIKDLAMIREEAPSQSSGSSSQTDSEDSDEEKGSERNTKTKDVQSSVESSRNSLVEESKLANKKPIDEQKSAATEQAASEDETPKPDQDQTNSSVPGLLRLGIVGERQISISSDSNNSFDSDTSLEDDVEEDETSKIATDIASQFERQSSVESTQSDLFKTINRDTKERNLTQHKISPPIKNVTQHNSEDALSQRRGSRVDSEHSDYSFNQEIIQSYVQRIRRASKTKRRVSMLSKDFSSMMANKSREEKINQTRRLNNVKRQSTVISLSTTTWVPMSDFGEFILYMVADTYLSHDFEYSLRISTFDFSYFSNTNLFEGNLLRFRALAYLEMFQDSLHDQDNQHLDEDFLLLTTAIASLENSLDIYEAKEELKAFEQNSYGMALCLYTLGHAYKLYSAQLCDYRYADVCNEEYKKYLTQTVSEGQEKACNYYKSAYKCFSQVSHLKGMYMSKKREASLIPQSQHQEIKKLEKKSKLLKVKYQKYRSKHGLDSSCHIEREHGSDISIMSEIVREQIHDCFPQPAAAEESSSTSSAFEDSSEEKDRKESQSSQVKVQGKKLNPKKLIRSHGSTIISSHQMLSLFSPDKAPPNEQNATSAAATEEVKNAAESSARATSPLKNSAEEKPILTGHWGMQ